MKQTSGFTLDDLDRVWSFLLHNVLCSGGNQCCVDAGSDSRLAYSKVQSYVVEYLRFPQRYGSKQRARLLELTVRAVERQGYVSRAPLGDGTDQEIDLTEDGSHRLFIDDCPEFSDADLG